MDHEGGGLRAHDLFAGRRKNRFAIQPLRVSLDRMFVDAAWYSYADIRGRRLCIGIESSFAVVKFARS